MIRMDESGPIENRSARRRCYDTMREEIVSAYARYYKAHPEQIHTPEAELSLNSIIRLMQRMYAILDCYEISDKVVKDAGRQETTVSDGTTSEGCASDPSSKDR